MLTVAEKSLRIASYNIHKCVGTDRHFNPGRILAVLEEIDADVLALQEADLRFGDRKGLLNLDAVHERLGLVPAPLEGAQKNHGWRGNVVLVREAIVDKTHQLVLPGVEPRGAVWWTSSPSRCRSASLPRISGCCATRARNRLPRC